MSKNVNIYPEGRWTSRKDSLRDTVPTQRMPLFVQPAAAVLKAPLRDLFWGLPDSGILEEARQRVERVIAAALSEEPAPAPSTQPEFAWA